MAGTARTARKENKEGSEVRALREELNKVVTDLETLRAALDTVADQLDADLGVTDTDYAANAGVATASTMTAATVNA